MLIHVVIALIVVGLLLWLVSLIPMDATIHLIIRVVVVIAIVLWLLRLFGVLGAANGITL